MLSKRRQCEKATYSAASNRWHSGKSKIIDAVKITVVARTQRGESQEIFLGHWNYSICYHNGVYITLCICLKHVYRTIQQRVKPNVSHGL
jgi:hypothetical protein